MIPQIKKEITGMALFNKCRHDNILFEKYASRSIRGSELEIITLKATFTDKGSEVRSIIVKFPRIFNSSAALRTLQNEYDNLHIVEKLLAGTELAGSPPNALFLKTINAAPVLAVEFLQGKCLSNLLFSSDIFNKFMTYSPEVLSWLRSFQELTRQCGQHPLKDHLDMLADFHKEQFPNFAISDGIKIGQIKKLFHELPSINTACQHNDFHADNIFISPDGRLRLIDWEDFSEKSIPSFDAIHFIATFIDALFLILKNSGRLTAIEQINSDENWKKCFEEYFEFCMSSLNIPKGLREVIIPIYLLQSIYLASDERKKASAAISKLNFLLSTFPISISDLAESLELYHISDSQSGNKQKARLIDKISDRLSSADILKQLKF